MYGFIFVQSHSMFNLKDSIPKESFIAIHNEYNYGYHFIIKESAEECEGQFNCLGGNTEK